MKKMSLKKKRWLILGITFVVAAVGWWFLVSIAEQWVLSVALIGIMTEWQLIRCPMCGRHLGWFDKEICATCADAIAESEEKERRR